MQKAILLSACLIIFSCGNRDKGKKISGRLRNAEKSWIYLQQISEKGDLTIDSVRAASDGSFEMKNPSTSPEFYILRADPTNLIFLILKPGDNVEVNGDAKNLETTYTVRGSKDSELIQKLRSKDRTLSDSLNKSYEVLRVENPMDKESAALNLQKVYTGEMENFSHQLIKNNLTSLVSLSATKFLNQQADLSLMNTLKDSLLIAYPDNRYVKDYVILVNDLNKLPPGSVCPDISMNTPDGKSLLLSSYRGKIILVDFWASWCAPCRRENPAIVEMYRKFEGKDFEIFGVSLDENVAAWKNAIEKDGITWPQVSDLKKWDSPVVRAFHLEAIPYNILIDRTGKIIAKGIRTEELEIKIREALAIK